MEDGMLLYAEPAELRTLTIAGTGVRVHIRGVGLEGDRVGIVESVVNSVHQVLGDLPSVHAIDA